MSSSAPDPTDQQLLKIVTDPKPANIAEVIDRMDRLEAVLQITDGLIWFNWLYRLVTNNVDLSSGWTNPEWLTRLDVIFANMYFGAIETELGGVGRTPKSWQALFEARRKPGIDRIQFALAGMNAHINHDLALALLQTDRESGIVPSKTSLEHQDFESVNSILEAALPQTLNMLAAGVLGATAQDTGKIGRLLAMWNVRAARNLAWDFADHLRDLNAVSGRVALTAQDQMTGTLGRALLVI
ncbi:MAG TPA: DUF5995 family protein [Terriglobia bacterium]|jgi:hypothetical protein